MVLYNCKECKDTFTEDEFLQCARCKATVHVKCENLGKISVQTLKTVKKYSQFKWFCEFCDNAFKDICVRFTQITELMETSVKNN
jgi:hypothetical protein